MDTYIRDAETIWVDFKQKSREDVKFRELPDEARLEYYQKKYHNFAMSFPIVLRYMVQLGQYSKKAFTRHVKKMKTNPYRSELEYCERQADYVKYLYMELSPSHDVTSAQKMWKDTYDMLAREVEVFKKTEEIVKKKLEKNNSQNSMERRQELKRLLNV